MQFLTDFTYRNLYTASRDFPATARLLFRYSQSLSYPNKRDIFYIICLVCDFVVQSGSVIYYLEF